MDRKAFFQGIESTIKDWKATNFISNHKTYVPGLDDGNLSDSVSVDGYGRIISKSFVNQRSIVRKEKTYKYKPILISDNVYNAYKRLHPQDDSIVNGWWHKETRKVRDINFDVCGSDLTWAL